MHKEVIACTRMKLPLVMQMIYEEKFSVIGLFYIELPMLEKQLVGSVVVSVEKNELFVAFI
jgi:hypothetical protein